MLSSIVVREDDGAVFTNDDDQWQKRLVALINNALLWRVWSNSGAAVVRHQAHHSVCGRRPLGVADTHVHRSGVCARKGERADRSYKSRDFA